MPLYMGKYRRSCISKKPPKAGWYLAFYGRKGGAICPRYFDGQHWLAGKYPNYKTGVVALFEDMLNPRESLWAHLPKGESFEDYNL